jgi:hypothetical protein
MHHRLAQDGSSCNAQNAAACSLGHSPGGAYHKELICTVGGLPCCTSRTSRATTSAMAL